MWFEMLSIDDVEEVVGMQYVIVEYDLILLVVHELHENQIEYDLTHLELMIQLFHVHVRDEFDGLFHHRLFQTLMVM
jgi:hypothetical protein